VIVLVSVDGLAGFYFDDPKAEMPNLHAMAKDGVHASGVRASVPSVTWPNHTSLVTGCNPARHGVVGNNFFDRETGKQVALIGDPVYDKGQIVRVPTIYDLAKQAGRSTVGIRWPATKNADTLDWTIGDMKLDAMESGVSSALAADAKAAGLWPKSTVDADGKTVPGTFTDDICTDLFLYVMREKRTTFGMLHIIDVDHDQHQYGPRTEEAYAAVKAADARVGKVWSELKKQYPDNLSIIVASDHGFSPIERLIFPNVLLRDAGLIDVKGVRVVDGAVRTVIQGGSTLVYIMDEARRSEVEAKVKEVFAKVPEVQSVIGRDQLGEYGVADPSVDPHSPDMVIFAKEGYAFGDTAAGSMSFRDKPERKGTHGHDVNLPHLQASFIAWGDGIKKGVELGLIHNTDVAPTMAKLMGIEMKDIDGHCLNEALTE
jgi:predicted AlkP superfamily pyrophosphatase or phosphodiesterase